MFPRSPKGNLALLNTSIITTDGTFLYTTIPAEEAFWRITDASLLGELDSFIGHDATAMVLSQLTNVEIPVNRGMFSQEVDQAAIVFKLRSRLTEPRELSVEELNEIGYEFGVLFRLE